MKKILLILGLGLNLCSQAQSFFESFDDGDFTAPLYTWSGTAGSWNVATAVAGPNTIPSNTLKLNAAAAGTYYLSTPQSNWGDFQAWGFWMGRVTNVNANNYQYFWLWADQADVTSPTINGYRITMDATVGPDEIRLERVNAGVATTIITSSTGVPNGLDDYAFLVRVTRSAANVWTLFTGPDLSTLIVGGGDFPFAVPFFVSTLQGSATDAAPITIAPLGTAYMGVEATCGAPGTRQSAEFDNILFDANGTLPVTLESFKAVKDANKAKLDWKVGIEDNVRGYEIERSSTGVNFTKIGFVSAKGARNYNFIDEQILPGQNFYRLKTIDFDTKYAYSYIVSVNGNKGSFVKIFPNPASDRLYIQHTDATSNASIRIINLEGKMMQNVRIAENTVQTVLNIQSIPAGIYHVVYDYGNGEQKVSKFVKQ